MVQVYYWNTKKYQQKADRRRLEPATQFLIEQVCTLTFIREGYWFPLRIAHWRNLLPFPIHSNAHEIYPERTRGDFQCLRIVWKSKGLATVKGRMFGGLVGLWREMRASKIEVRARSRR